jgi:hypothetical protein
VIFGETINDSNREHLHKAHYEKFKCPRCKILLRSSDFEEHSLALEACHPRPEHEGDPEIGFSHAFDISLKMRKRSSPEHEGIARWVEIYSQLFPNEPVPNPCRLTKSLLSSAKKLIRTRRR